jgi:hypothetical protein
MAHDHMGTADTLALALDTCGCIPYTARGSATPKLIHQCAPQMALREPSVPHLAAEAARAVSLDSRPAPTMMITVTGSSRKRDPAGCWFATYALSWRALRISLRLIARV